MCVFVLMHALMTNGINLPIVFCSLKRIAFNQQSCIRMKINGRVHKLLQHSVAFFQENGLYRRDVAM